MKLKKVIGSVTHLVDLPDNVARQMLEKHPGLFTIVEEKKPVAQGVEEKEEIKEEQKDDEEKKPARGRRRA